MDAWGPCTLARLVHGNSSSFCRSSWRPGLHQRQNPNLCYRETVEGGPARRSPAKKLGLIVGWQVDGHFMEGGQR